MKQAHNKTSTEQLNAWSARTNIHLQDREYINNAFNHTWKCAVHDEIHVARWDKIKVAGGLKCCTLAGKLARKMGRVERFCKQYNIALSGTYKDSQTPTMWTCNLHNESHLATRFNLEHSRGKLPCCRAGRHGHTLEEVRAFADTIGLEFTDLKFNGVHEYHLWKCVKHGKIHQTKFSILKGGSLLQCCEHELGSGANHPRYNSDVTDEQRIKDRRSPENRRWGQAVIKRDDCTCQKCKVNIKEAKIVAHHVMSYLDHPDLRFDVDNGVTLCVTCHKAFHKRYGLGKNNAQQLMEFMSC